MSKYLHIYNDGLIDVKAFELIGASTKRNDDSKIGFFGSGLKYSIAALLRNEIDFKVFSGGEEYSFTTEKQEFRGESFDQILINGKQTSFTTQMGPDWEPWFIVREIYCNALDELNGGYEICDEYPVIDLGKTQFIITIDKEIQDVVKNWNNYFADGRKDLLYYNESGKIYEKVGIGHELVYRKGIRAFFCEKRETDDYKMLFSYDFESLDINESRVAKYEWQVYERIGYILGSCNDKNIIRRLINAFQIDLVYELFAMERCYFFSETWLEVIDKRILIPREFGGFYEEEYKSSPEKYLIAPSVLIKRLKSFFGTSVRSITEEDDTIRNGELFKITTMTPKIDYLLKDCLKSLTEMEYGVDFPIAIGKFNKENVLGRANIRHQRIELSERLFDLGKRQIAATIIEECEHLKTSYKDETREFQNHWINLYLSEKEQRFGLFL